MQSVMQKQSQRSATCSGNRSSTTPCPRFLTTTTRSRGQSVSALCQDTSKSPESCEAQSVALSRRDALAAGMAASLAGLVSAGPSWAAAAATDAAPFFKYSPTTDKTPAIRAGVIRPPFYTMNVPTGWKEAKIANILSGNFCMPGCGEPWTEVIFENPSEGKLQLLVSPLVKLTNKANTPIQDLGTPEAILPRIGGYITGTYLEEEDLVAFSSKVQDDGLTYYYYEIFAPAANGHSLTAVTTKGEGCYLFVCSAASEKSWKNNEGKLRQLVEAFRA